MSEDKIKILYGHRAISYKNGNREEIPLEKIECLYKPSPPFVNNILKNLERNSAEQEFLRQMNAFDLVGDYMCTFIFSPEIDKEGFCLFKAVEQKRESWWRKLMRYLR